MTGGSPDMFPGLPLANILDALGRRVTVEESRSGLAVILTRSPDEGLNGGHPALNGEHARVIGNALLAFADRDSS